jgi:hypothetical protein
MPQAEIRNNTLTILDAIAPQRQRFGVINNPNPMSRTMAAIECAVADLAAKGNPATPGAEPRNPYETFRGVITDGAKFTQWEINRLQRRRAAKGDAQ